jgi:hypothetical protein
MYPNLNNDDFEYVLWTWTQYPFAETKKIAKQFSSRIRAGKTYEICWFCGCNKKFKHHKKCPDANGELWRIM